MIKRLRDFENIDAARKYLGAMEGIHDQMLCAAKENPRALDFLWYIENANDKELKQTTPDTIRSVAAQLKQFLQVAILRQDVELYYLEHGE